MLDAVVETLERERGFSVDVGHFAVFGRCRECTASVE